MSLSPRKRRHWWDVDAPPVKALVHHRPVVVIAPSFEAGRAWIEANPGVAGYGQVVTDPAYLWGWPADAEFITVPFEPGQDLARRLRLSLELIKVQRARGAA